MVHARSAPKTRGKVARKVGYDTEDAATMDYGKVYGVASTIADTAYVLEGFSVSSQERDELSSPADDYRSKVTPNAAERHTPPVSKPIHSADADWMKTVTRALEALALSQQVMANRIAATQGPAVAAGASSFMPGALTAGAAGGAGWVRADECLYCGGPHRRYGCPDFNTACARGEIHLNNRYRISLGRSGDGDETLFIPRGQLQKVAVQNTVQNAAQRQQNAAQRRQEGRVAAPVHTSSLRLGEEYDSDTAADTDEEGEPAIVEVLTAKPDRQSGRYRTT